MRKRYSVCVLLPIASLLVTHQPARAATAQDCAGSHTYNMPDNALAPVFSATMTESWDRSCADVDTSGAPFGALTVTHDVFGPGPSTYSGNCAFGFSTAPDNGVRFFIGAVSVGEGTVGSAAQVSVAALGVPSNTPCVGGTITWSGVENWITTP